MTELLTYRLELADRPDDQLMKLIDILTWPNRLTWPTDWPTCVTDSLEGMTAWPICRLTPSTVWPDWLIWMTDWPHWLVTKKKQPIDMIELLNWLTFWPDRTSDLTDLSDWLTVWSERLYRMTDLIDTLTWPTNWLTEPTYWSERALNCLT